ncbi:MAG: hypothetical protein NUW37_15960 [Planctomycetes bacterium]|nr:hypothetical protein [Planctomycetota bacterium]
MNSKPGCKCMNRNDSSFDGIEGQKTKTGPIREAERISHFPRDNEPSPLAKSDAHRSDTLYMNHEPELEVENQVMEIKRFSSVIDMKKDHNFEEIATIKEGNDDEEKRRRDETSDRQSEEEERIRSTNPRNIRPSQTRATRNPYRDLIQNPPVRPPSQSRPPTYANPMPTAHSEVLIRSSSIRGTAPSRHVSICGPDVTDWFIEEIAIHVGFFNRFLMAFNDNLNIFVPPNTNLALTLMAPKFKAYAKRIPYKNFIFLSDNCLWRRECIHTVTICGICISPSELGNIMYGIIGWMVGFTEYELVWAGANEFLTGRGNDINKIEDIAAVMLGIILGRNLEFSQQALCQTMTAKFSDFTVGGGTPFITTLRDRFTRDSDEYALLNSLTGESVASALSNSTSQCPECVEVFDGPHSNFSFRTIEQWLGEEDEEWWKVYDNINGQNIDRSALDNAIG